MHLVTIAQPFRVAHEGVLDRWVHRYEALWLVEALRGARYTPVGRFEVLRISWRAKPIHPDRSGMLGHAARSLIVTRKLASLLALKTYALTPSSSRRQKFDPRLLQHFLDAADRAASAIHLSPLESSKCVRTVETDFATVWLLRRFSAFVMSWFELIIGPRPLHRSPRTERSQTIAAAITRVRL